MTLEQINKLNEHVADNVNISLSYSAKLRSKGFQIATAMGPFMDYCNSKGNDEAKIEEDIDTLVNLSEQVDNSKKIEMASNFKKAFSNNNGNGILDNIKEVVDRDINYNADLEIQNNGKTNFDMAIAEIKEYMGINQYDVRLERAKETYTKNMNELRNLVIDPNDVRTIERANHLAEALRNNKSAIESYKSRANNSKSLETIDEINGLSGRINDLRNLTNNLKLDSNTAKSLIDLYANAENIIIGYRKDVVVMQRKERQYQELMSKMCVKPTLTDVNKKDFSKKEEEKVVGNTAVAAPEVEKAVGIDFFDNTEEKSQNFFGDSQVSELPINETPVVPENKDVEPGAAVISETPEEEKVTGFDLFDNTEEKLQNVFDGSQVSELPINETPVVPENKDVEPETAVISETPEEEKSKSKRKRKVVNAKKCNGKKFNWDYITIAGLVILGGTPAGLALAGAWLLGKVLNDVIKNIKKPHVHGIISGLRKIAKRPELTEEEKNDIEEAVNISEKVAKEEFGSEEMNIPEQEVVFDFADFDKQEADRSNDDLESIKESVGGEVGFMALVDDYVNSGKVDADGKKPEEIENEVAAMINEDKKANELAANSISL